MFRSMTLSEMLRKQLIKVGFFCIDNRSLLDRDGHSSRKSWTMIKRIRGVFVRIRNGQTSEKDVYRLQAFIATVFLWGTLFGMILSWLVRR